MAFLKSLDDEKHITCFSHLVSPIIISTPKIGPDCSFFTDQFVDVARRTPFSIYSSIWPRCGDTWRRTLNHAPLLPVPFDRKRSTGDSRVNYGHRLYISPINNCWLHLLLSRNYATSVNVSRFEERPGKSEIDFRCCLEAFVSLILLRWGER